MSSTRIQTTNHQIQAIASLARLATTLYSFFKGVSTRCRACTRVRVKMKTISIGHFWSGQNWASYSYRLVVHALCFDQLYCCTYELFGSLCTLVQENLVPNWPLYDVRTCWNLIGQYNQNDPRRPITELETIDRQNSRRTDRTAEGHLGYLKVDTGWSKVNDINWMVISQPQKHFRSSSRKEKFTYIRTFC